MNNNKTLKNNKRQNNIEKTAAIKLESKKKENKGQKYENDLYNKIKEVKEKELLTHLELLPKSSSCSNKGVDIPLKFYYQ